MIESNEDIGLVVEQQLQDVRSAQQEARDISEGREVHPAVLAEQTRVAAETAARTEVEQLPAQPPPPAPPAAGSTLFLRGALALGFTVLFVILWLRQRK